MKITFWDDTLRTATVRKGKLWADVELCEHYVCVDYQDRWTFQKSRRMCGLWMRMRLTVAKELSLARRARERRRTLKAELPEDWYPVLPEVRLLKEKT